MSNAFIDTLLLETNHFLAFSYSEHISLSFAALTEVQKARDAAEMGRECLGEVPFWWIAAEEFVFGE